MRVVIRTDASFEIGTGHVMRCLTLARALRANAADVSFISREEPGHLCELIEEMDFRCARLPAWTVRRLESASFVAEDVRQSRAVIKAWDGNPDLLVVDHYQLDRAWESALREDVSRIFVIDDLANRVHDCDLLLDQNLHDFPESRYSSLVPARAQIFVGPRYALLRPEFNALPALPRTRGLTRMLAFFGGVDSTNEALKVVEALRLIGSSAPQTDVVLGPTNSHYAEVAHAAGGLTCVNVLRQTDDMATLMRQADLGLGTCGVAAWERCSVGLPALVVVNADNQRDDARILHSLGAVHNLGEASNATINLWASGIRAMRDDPVSLTLMSIAAASIMRGHSQAMNDLGAALVS